MMALRHLRDRRGGVASVAAVLIIVLIGFAGFAVDITRSWMVSARLKTAVDAAALLAARQIDQASRDTQATQLFWANFRRNGPAGTGYLGSTTANPTITQIDANRIRVEASATVPTTLFNVIARRNVTVTESSVAQRGGTGLELALVMDQTSSMNATVPTMGGVTKLAAAQSAVGTLLNILYGTNDTQPNLWISVVPFSRTINIGTANATLLNTAGMPPGWNVNAWSGCVAARSTAGNDLNDSAPVTAATRLPPFFWPSTYQQVGTVEAGRCTATDAYPSQGIGQPRYCFGDNDWGAPQALLDTNPAYAFLRARGMTQAASAGPNFLCALTPLQPLTASRATLQAMVNSITAPIRSGGTDIVTGMQGAWYTLSPQWQGVWQNPNPSGGPALPFAYNTPNMRKAVILLSDGDNNWQPAGSYSNRVRGAAVGGELFHGAYGRAGNWNAAGMTPAVTPGNQASGDAAADNRFAQVCANMRAQGILIYVIGFEVATAAQRTMLQTCSSGATDYYFESPTAADLQNAFTQVAARLTALRLAE